MNIRDNIFFSPVLNVVLILFFFTCINTAAYGQNQTKQEVKQLKAELSGLAGEERVRILLSLSRLSLTYSADSSFIYAQEALKLSRNLNNDTLTGRSYMTIGFLHMMKGNDSLSISAFSEATTIFKEIRDSVNLAWNLMLTGQYYYYKNDYANAMSFYIRSLDIYVDMNDASLYSRVIQVMSEISYVYYDQMNYKQSLNYLFKALRIAEVMNDKSSGRSSLLTSIGNIYLDWKQYDVALGYFVKAYEINRKSNDNKALAYSLNDLGKVYFETGQYEKAFYYHKKAAELFSEINDNIGISISNTYLGKYYKTKGKYNTALNYFKTALANCEQNQQQSIVSILLYETGSAYYHMNLLDKALESSKKSLAIAEGIKYKDYIYNNYLLISDIYAAKKNYQEALEFYRRYVSKKDSIFTADIYQHMADAEDKYKADQRQKEIEILKQEEQIQIIDMRRQRIFRNSLLIVVGLLAALAVVILRSYRQKRRDNFIIAAEKYRSEKLLMNILPEETAEELKKEGFAKPRYYENVSVLFTDFKGFTAFSEKLSPEKLVAELDYCFRAYDLIMEKYHIEKIKTIGDSYMCAGGLPVPNTTHPVDIVRCGLEICRFMEEYKTERLAENRPFFELRLGIHTGPVVSGIVGTKKFAYDIWGDTVNTASRMESSGVIGKVNISGSTYEYVKDHFKCAYRGKVEAKNKGLIDMYLVEPSM
ncbi:MAG TPA: adenylate/guanylate cyclase domain-containing protein [Bacteroidales bacterium]|nr:adenylate/guanylate cyclase domain-containing protein [Bacteroidales bacterium]